MQNKKINSSDEFEAMLNDDGAIASDNSEEKEKENEDGKSKKTQSKKSSKKTSTKKNGKNGKEKENETVQKKDSKLYDQIVKKGTRAMAVTHGVL